MPTYTLTPEEMKRAVQEAVIKIADIMIAIESNAVRQDGDLFYWDEILDGMTAAYRVLAALIHSGAPAATAVSDQYRGNEPYAAVWRAIEQSGLMPTNGQPGTPLLRAMAQALAAYGREVPKA